MAVYTDKGEVLHEGRVLGTRSHFWLDGMEELYAVVWDMEEHTKKEVQIGYYGIDGQNLMGNTYAVIDATEEVRRDILRTLKNSAKIAYARSVESFKKKVHRGSNVVVCRGRKVPKGTELTVFWVGEKETYMSRQYSWRNETEEIAGCLDAEGNKYWLKTEYLRVTDDIKSPNRHEREKFIKAYIEKNRCNYFM